MKAWMLAVVMAFCLCTPTIAKEPGRDSIFGEDTWIYETGAYKEALELWDLMRLQQAIEDYERELDDWEDFLKELDDYLYGSGGMPIS